MSTSPQPLKYLWNAIFEDDNFIAQPPNDQYSKHVEGAEWNPSSFRDLLDYQEKSPLVCFYLISQDHIVGQNCFYAINLFIGEFSVTSENGIRMPFSLEDEPLTERKLIYYREMHKDNIDGEWQQPRVNAYIFGYEGKDPDGKVHKKTIRIT